VPVKVLATAAIATLKTTPGALTPLNSLTPNNTDHLMLALTLPSAAPGDISKLGACSGTAGGTSATENMEGCTSSLKYNFVATQRAGGTQ
jgi:hypothetical protein